MALFLTQSADVERVRAYASELEALALEMERVAGEGEAVINGEVDKSVRVPRP
jgi:hypothetical protein